MIFFIFIDFRCAKFVANNSWSFFAMLWTSFNNVKTRLPCGPQVGDFDDQELMV